MVPDRILVEILAGLLFRLVGIVGSFFRVAFFDPGLFAIIGFLEIFFELAFERRQFFLRVVSFLDQFVSLLGGEPTADGIA